MSRVTSGPPPRTTGRAVVSLLLLVAIVVVLIGDELASDDVAIYDVSVAWAADDADNDIDASGLSMPSVGAAATAPRPSDGIVWCAGAASAAVSMLSARLRADATAPRAPPLLRYLVLLSSLPRSPPPSIRSAAPLARIRRNRRGRSGGQP